jgi:hypothetical protein
VKARTVLLQQSKIGRYDNTSGKEVSVVLPQTSSILPNSQSRPQGWRASRPAATAGQSPFPCAADAGRSVLPKFLYPLPREQSALFPLQQPRKDPDSGTLAQSRCGTVRPRRCEARGATPESYQAPEWISPNRSECRWSKSHSPSALRLQSPPPQLQPPIAQKLQHRHSPTPPRPLGTALGQHGTVASSRQSSDQQFQFASAPQRSETPSVRREPQARPIRNAPGDPGPLSYPEFSFELSIAHTIRVSWRPRALGGGPLRCGHSNDYFISSIVPSDHLVTGTIKIVTGSGALVAAKTGEPLRFAPQLAASVGGRKNITCGCQWPSLSFR